MATYIYSCKSCKKGRRVEYPFTSGGRDFRRNESGAAVPAGIWVSACGGGKPTVYGGDLENGFCACGKAMASEPLKARLVPGHKCDSRCTGARRGSCDCSCGGANHGMNAGL